ncbi:MAG: 23S rRNA (adenine(2503)-C(2))-methyltransferase RlmN [Pirellulales bacterium]
MHLLDYSSADLRSWCAERFGAGYRADQIRHWLFQRRAGDFAEMSDLPRKLRDELTDCCQLWTADVRAHRQASDGTEKLLLAWPDGETIECVLLREPRRTSICISTQVGCAMGCAFCASGLNGVSRNLTTGEITEQMLRLNRLLGDDERLSHIVVMGMGEPLANLDALLGALAGATDPKGLGISARRITISTVGLPPAIRRLAELNVPYHLAVSLHAPDDELRNRLVRVNRHTGIEEILAAADAFFQATGRRVTFEYVLLGGVNDSPQHASRLAHLLRGRPALVNLIPYNPVAGLEFGTPRPEDVREFADVLDRRGITTAVRKRKGDRIDAACGQLRRIVGEGQSVTVDPP